MSKNNLPPKSIFSDSGKTIITLGNENPVYPPVKIPLRNITHLLVSGTTSSGKSTLLENIIIQTIKQSNPAFNQFYVISTLNYYELEQSNFLPLGISKPEEAYGVAKLLNSIIDDRLKKFRNSKSKDSFDHYEKTKDYFPDLFLIIDSYEELLTFSHSVEPLLLKITQLGRAVGVHLFIANQSAKNSLFDNIPFRMTGYSPNKMILAETSGLTKNHRLLHEFTLHDFIYTDFNGLSYRFKVSPYSESQTNDIVANTDSTPIKQIDNYPVETYKEKLVEQERASWTPDHKNLKPFKRVSIFG